MKNIFLILLPVFLLLSCQSKTKDNENEPAIYENEAYDKPKVLGTDEDPSSPKTLADDIDDIDDEKWTSFEKETGITKEEAAKLVSFYLELKSELVDADVEQASAFAASMHQILEGNESELVKALYGPVEAIMQAVQIEEQRKYFSALSDEILKIVENTNPVEFTIYLKFCPMAMGNEGAYWLSSDKEIRNPYFGDKMLRCGTIKEIIQ